MITEPQKTLFALEKLIQDLRVMLADVQALIRQAAMASADIEMSVRLFREEEAKRGG